MTHPILTVTKFLKEVTHINKVLRLIFNFILSDGFKLTIMDFGTCQGILNEGEGSVQLTSVLR